MWCVSSIRAKRISRRAGEQASRREQADQIRPASKQGDETSSMSSVVSVLPIQSPNSQFPIEDLSDSKRAR